MAMPPSALRRRNTSLTNDVGCSVWPGGRSAIRVRAIRRRSSYRRAANTSSGCSLDESSVGIGALYPAELHLVVPKPLDAARPYEARNPMTRWDMFFDFLCRRQHRIPPVAGNLEPCKIKSTERIEGIVTAIMALGRAILRPVRPGAARTGDRLAAQSASSASVAGSFSRHSAALAS